MGVWLFFRAGLRSSSCVAMEMDGCFNLYPWWLLVYEQKMKQQIVTKKGRGQIKSSTSITFSSISLPASGRFRGLEELGVSLDWKRRQSA